MPTRMNPPRRWAPPTKPLAVRLPLRRPRVFHIGDIVEVSMTVRLSLVVQISDGDLFNGLYRG